MAAINKIFISDTQTEGRFDAEYFHPKYKHLDYLLHSINAKDKIVQLSYFVKKGIFDISPAKYRTVGVPLIRTTQIKTPISNENDLIFIDDSEHKKNYSKTELLPGDIVFTKIGAGIGDVAILNKNYPYYNFSQNVAGLSIRKEIIDPYFLIACLISEIGREQIIRFMMPSGQGKLELKDIKKIVIPRFPDHEKKIAELIRSAEKLTNDSATLYTQATQLLEEALGLDKIEFKQEKCFRTSFSEVINRNRIDSEHFQPKYRKIKELVYNYRYGYEHFLQNVKYIKPNFDPSKHPNDDFYYIELSDINPSLGTIEAVQPIKGKNAPSRARRIVEAGDIIASSVVGSVEKAGLVSSLEHGYLASTGFFHFRSTFYSPEFLLLLVKSKIFKEQLFQQSTGGILSSVPEANLIHLIIPKFPYEVIDEATNLVRKSHKYYHRSKQLLEQAKQEVETLIEQAAQKHETLERIY